MYDKILTMERVMQAEIDQLKERELELITCMQKDRETILEEKTSVEKVHYIRAIRMRFITNFFKEELA